MKFEKFRFYSNVNETSKSRVYQIAKTHAKNSQQLANINDIGWYLSSVFHAFLICTYIYVCARTFFVCFRVSFHSLVLCVVLSCFRYGSGHLWHFCLCLFIVIYHRAVTSAEHRFDWIRGKSDYLFFRSTHWSVWKEKKLGGNFYWYFTWVLFLFYSYICLFVACTYIRVGRLLCNWIPFAFSEKRTKQFPNIDYYTSETMMRFRQHVQFL